MHSRRILLAFSLAASAASVAFADLVELDSQNSSTDRIEQLTRTLSQGSYTETQDIDVPAQTQMTVKLREKTTELNNASLAKKYGTQYQHPFCFFKSLCLVSVTSITKCTY